MPRPIFCFAVCATVVFAGCGGSTDSPPNPLGASNSTVSTALVECPPGAISDTDVFFDKTLMDQDTLVLDARFAGGCRPHSFGLCWDGTFLESNPVQAELRLIHDDGGDSCEALLIQQLRFDISSLRAAYQAGYQSSTGTVLLNLNHVIEGRYDF